MKFFKKFFKKKRITTVKEAVTSTADSGSTLLQESIGYRGELADAGLTIKSIRGRKRLCDSSGNIVYMPNYDDIISSGWIGRGFKVRSGDKWGMLNERLEVMIPIEYEDIFVVYKSGFMVKKGGKWGYLPTYGAINPDCIYEEVDTLIDLHIPSGWNAFRAKKDGKWGVADFDGNVIVAFNFDEISLGANGMAKVKSGALYGFVNANNGNVIPTEYDYAEDFNSNNADMTVVGKNGLKGVIDIDGTPIIPLRYENAYIDGEDRFRVKKDEYYGIIDKELNSIFPFVYRDLGKFDEEGVTYAMDEEGGYGYVDINNTVIHEFEFTSARNFNQEGFAVISIGYRYGFIDRQGQSVFPTRNEGIYVHYWDGIEKLDNYSPIINPQSDFDFKLAFMITGQSHGFMPGLPLRRNADGTMEFDWEKIRNEEI